MERLSGIYRIVNKTNGKYYVGSSNNISKRFRDHKRELTFNRHHCIGLQRAWNKYDSNKFDFIIVENISSNDLLTIEQKHLDNAMTHKENCYNSSFVAGGGIIWKDGINPRTGTKHTEETLQKMREAAKGRILSKETKERLRNFMLSINNSHRGQKHSEETKRKIGIGNKGKKRTEEQRIKNGYAFRGKKHTEEWKRKMSERMKGKKKTALVTPADNMTYLPTGTNSNVSPLTFT